MKVLLLVITSVVLYACSESASTDTVKVQRIEQEQMPDSVLVYIQSALDTMRKHSINTKKVDWIRLSDTVFKNAAHARDFRGTYEAIAIGLKMLGDNHSRFAKPEDVARWKGSSKPSAPNKRGKRFRISGFMLDNIAKISIGSYASGDSIENLLYSTELQSLIASLDKNNPDGWILDLRYNRGGNLWPMLLGVSPLLPEGDLGQFVNNGDRVAWYYRDGAVGTAEGEILRLANSYRIKNSDSPIAVFVNNSTASSAEALLLAFKARRNTVTIGVPTAGLSTGNRNYDLSDGAQLILTTAVFADVDGNLYGKRIVPDINISRRWYYTKIFEHQIAFNEATEWIQGRR